MFLELSPIKVLFAHKLLDGVLENLDSLKLRPEWVLTSSQREKVLTMKNLAGVNI